MRNESDCMGRDGFYWWHGVVEDRQDPDKLGKVKVRILGTHTKDKSYIKTEDLQWAYVMQPITSAAMNGIGITPLGVILGTWVFGFYRDGDAGQEPCILGTFGGIPQDPPDNTQGFNDPRDSSGTIETLATAPRHIKTRNYPFDGSGAQLTNGTQGSQFPLISHLKEPDTNRIARNELINKTILQIIKNIIDGNVPIAFGGTWSEPPLWYNGIYPYIHVIESESGHIKVVDDTPNSEGQLDIDRTGTFVENLTDGSEVHKIVKNGYTIIMEDDHIHIMGNEYARCDHEYNLSVGGRWNVEVKGNINIKADSGGAFIQVSGDANIIAGGNVNVESTNNINVKSVGNLNLQSGGSMNLKAAGIIGIDGPQVYINSKIAGGAGSAIPPKQ
jgi:hypothetical protein